MNKNWIISVYKPNIFVCEYVYNTNIFVCEEYKHMGNNTRQIITDILYNTSKLITTNECNNNSILFDRCWSTHCSKCMDCFLINVLVEEQ